MVLEQSVKVLEEIRVTHSGDRYLFQMSKGRKEKIARRRKEAEAGLKL